MKQCILRIIIGLFACVSNLLAQDSLGVTKVNDFGGWTNVISDMEIRGDFALMLIEGDGLQVYRLIDEQVPQYISRDMALAGTRLQLLDTLALVWRDSSHIRLADIGDPEDPQFLSELTTNEEIKDVERFADHYLALSSRTSGLWIFDIMNSESPTLVAQLDFPTNTLDVEKWDNYLYLSGPDSLRTIDVSDPMNPLHVSSIAAPNSSIIVRNAHIYAAQFPSRRFAIYGLDDLTLPVLRADTISFFNASFREFSGTGDIVCINSANWSNDGMHYVGYVTLYRIDQPDTMIQSSSIGWIGNMISAIGDSTLIICPPGHGWFEIYDVSENGSTGFDLSDWHGLNIRNEIMSRGDIFLTTMAGHGWSLYSVSTPYDPVITFQYVNEEHHEAPAIGGHWAAFRYTDAIGRVYDIVNPANPIEFDWQGSPLHFLNCQTIRDSIRFGGGIQSDPRCLSAMEITDDRTLVFLDTLTISSTIREIVATDVFVYLRTDSGLTIVNSSTLDSLWLMSNL